MPSRLLLGIRHRRCMRCETARSGRSKGLLHAFLGGYASRPDLATLRWRRDAGRTSGRWPGRLSLGLA